MESNYEVSCSSTDGSGLTDFVTEPPVKDTTLKGQVAVFADASAITEGTYTLDVSGADSIQVYYEPDVKFGIGLYRGDEQVDAETIEGGTYDVDDVHRVAWPEDLPVPAGVRLTREGA